MNKMCSSSSSTFLPLHLPRRNRLILHFSHQFPIFTKNPKTPRFISFSASITQNNLQFSSDRPDVDDYNGWAILEQNDFIPKPPKKGTIFKTLDYLFVLFHNCIEVYIL